MAAAWRQSLAMANSLQDLRRASDPVKRAFMAAIYFLSWEPPLLKPNGGHFIM